MIRIASFNLENLFTRPTAMSMDNEANNREVLEDFSTANAIISKEVYSDDDKTTLIQLSEKYGWHLLNQPFNALIIFQKVRGQLFKKPVNKPIEVVANGRADWVGWFELKREDVEWMATYNTGRVINEVKADILVCVEIESRPTLDRFNTQVLKEQFGFSYPYLMVIDGNDQRGIDLGILSNFPIAVIRSHVHDNKDGSRIFSRDCPEYDIERPGSETIVVMPNHFKSKRNGNDEDSRARRKLQADTAHDIAINALNRTDLVLIAGDLNDTPDSESLQPLFQNDFKDIQSHPSYPTERPGTYDTGTAGNKIDYLIMSPALQNKLNETGIERRGSYHPRTWEPFDTVTKKSEEASDHQLIWGDFGG
jgi:endonuclease/exonuclease/phosphatase family metal-dependent hydrolase